MFYLYKIINLNNGKYYIGRAKSDDPYNHSYMGSGRLIKRAIQKYGIDSFKKEIIMISESEDEIAQQEAEYVTPSVVDDPNCYNMHEGGYGGWYHINKLPPNERKNLRILKEKIESGEILPTGGDTSKYFTTESLRKMKEGSVKGVAKLKMLFDDEDWKKEFGRKISEAQKKNPKSNWSLGTHLYTDGVNRKRYKEGEQPIGWVTTTEANEKARPKRKFRWYTNGTKNTIVYGDKVAPEGYWKGRTIQ